MKGLITVLLAAFSFGQCLAQSNNCEDLKKQNQKLQDKLVQLGININDSSTKIKSYTDDITFNTLKCIGDRKTQTVTVSFNVFNPAIANQKLTVEEHNTYYRPQYTQDITQAFDEIGNGYKPISAILGSAKDNYSGFQVSCQLSTGGTPVVGKIVFANILPTVLRLSNVTFAVKLSNLLGEENLREGIVEFRNITINWK